MKIKLFALMALQAVTPFSFAYETGPEIFGKENDLELCVPTRREEYVKIKKNNPRWEIPKHSKIYY